jgi:hypothetical protein
MKPAATGSCRPEGRVAGREPHPDLGVDTEQVEGDRHQALGEDAQEFAAFRADVEGSFLRTLELAGDLGRRARAARRAERFLGVLTGAVPMDGYFAPTTCSGSSASAAWPG